MGDVKLYGTKYSRYTIRVKIALKIKGIEYDFVEENLQDKSPQLLKYNPIHKKVPVLVHNGKPICESLVILEYIDETWEGNSLLPSDPYERAKARFWAKFIDDKLLLGMKALNTLKDIEGEEAPKALKEAHEMLNFLENEISGKKFFGGNDVGYVDIVGILVTYWTPIFQETFGHMVLVTRDKYPSICTWGDHLMACNVFKEIVPDKDTLAAVFRARYGGQSLVLK